MRSRDWLIVSSIVFGTLGAWGQRQGGAPSGGGGNTPPPTQGPTQGPSQQNDPFGRGRSSQQFPDLQQQRQQQRMIYFTGKVMLDDGTPPPEPVTILRVCNGQRRPETYTDSKGRFSFHFGGNPSLAMSDASVSGSEMGGFGNDPFSTGPGGGSGGGNMGPAGLGQVDLTGCDLKAELPGFRSEVVSLGRRSVFDNPDVGVIILHRLGNVEGIVSVTTLEAPKKAKSAYEKGLKEMRNKNPNPEKAAKQFEKAVGEYPKFALAWAALGETRAGLNDNEGAREAFEKAIEADPKYLRPYLPMVRLDLAERRWDEAAGLCEHVLQLNPHLTEVQYYHAVASFNAGEIEAAEKSALAIQSGKEAGNFPQIHQLVGMINARQGKFNQAASAYRSYLSVQPEGPVAADLQRQLTEWEALGVIEKAAK